MKLFLPLAIAASLLFISSCQEKIKNEKTSSTQKPEEEYETDNYEWLIGKWKRVNESSNKQTYENWEKLDSLSYQGMGFKMQGGDTIWQENMKWIKIEGKWSYEVSTPKNADLTTFVQSMASDTSFKAENPEHDFPTTIEYSLVDNRLKAVVSNPQKSILFEFERLNE